ncbi:MAG: 30S ribosomal protein S21 [Candidatus Kerfeldbacteria bacterium]|nr:30S ribosomal protein S21 [Candidatus Kerfeldbacteria bacterium]
MVEVRKKDNESSDSLIRRFTRRVQSSGILLHVKKIRYHERRKNKNQIREDAIRRAKNKEKQDYLRKIGKLEEVVRPKHSSRGF